MLIAHGTLFSYKITAIIEFFHTKFEDRAKNIKGISQIFSQLFNNTDLRNFQKKKNFKIHKK
jgi:hypothetical protein